MTDLRRDVKFMNPGLPIFHKKRMGERLYEEFTKEFPEGGFTKQEIVSALEKAYAEDEAFKAEMHRKGEQTLKFLEDNGKFFFFFFV